MKFIFREYCYLILAVIEKSRSWSEQVFCKYVQNYISDIMMSKSMQSYKESLVGHCLTVFTDYSISDEIVFIGDEDHHVMPLPYFLQVLQTRLRVIIRVFICHAVHQHMSVHRLLVTIRLERAKKTPELNSLNRLSYYTSGDF